MTARPNMVAVPGGLAPKSTEWVAGFMAITNGKAIIAETKTVHGATIWKYEAGDGQLGIVVYRDDVTFQACGPAEYIVGLPEYQAFSNQKIGA
jgi:hypothetical protein